MRLLFSLGLGFCHTFWYYAVVNIVIQSLDTIVALIMLVLFGVLISVVADNSVVKTYYVYNKDGGYIKTIYTLEAADRKDSDPQ